MAGNAAAVFRRGRQRPRTRYGDETFAACDPEPAAVPARALRRRGVLLLVVLCLLMLFAMIGVTFVLVASQSRRAIRAETRAEQYGDDYKKQCDEVFAQLVRDVTVSPSTTTTPNNPRSVLMWHSLLNDMYGTDGVTGTVSSRANADAGGQLLDITISQGVTNLQQPGAHDVLPVPECAAAPNLGLFQRLRADDDGRPGQGHQHADRRLGL